MPRKVFKIISVGIMLCIGLNHANAQDSLILRVSERSDDFTVYRNYYYSDTASYKYMLKVYVDSILSYRTYVDSIYPDSSSNARGPITAYYPNGNVQFTGYNDSMSYQSGRWTYYYSNGNFFAIENYKRGAKHGCAVEFYEDGQVKVTGRYNNPESGYTHHDYESKICTWIYYFQNGKKQRVEEYWSGRPIKRHKKSLVDKDGTVNIQGITDYYEDGLAKLHEYKKSVRHGRWTYYNQSEEVIKIEFYRKGKLYKIVKGKSGTDPQD